MTGRAPASGTDEKKFVETISNAIFSSFLFGNFLAAAILYVTSQYQKSTISIGVIVLVLVVYMRQLMRLGQARRDIARFGGRSPDASLLLSETSAYRTIIFMIIGGVTATAIVLLMLKFTDVLKAQSGAVPSLSILGIKMYATAVGGVLLWFAGLWGCRLAIKGWAARLVGARLEGARAKAK